MSIQDAQHDAVRRSISELRHVDLAARSPLLGLPGPRDSTVRFRAFGLDYRLSLPSFDLALAEGTPAKLGDHILVLHYLQCDRRIEPTGEIMSFRNMPGGQFYWHAFRSRSIEPLIKCIGNRVELLSERLGRYDWQPFEAGDFGARIHGIGRLEATLVYHRGDEEGGPAADVLFDACIKRVYQTEDVAYFASRLCFGLL